MSSKLKIAIDGPSGAGKSTIAKCVAKNLGIIHVDTGLMYRAASFLAIQRQIDCKSNVDALIDLLKSNLVEIKRDRHLLRVYIENHDMTNYLRTIPEISDITSRISQIAEIRQYLVNWQRKLAQTYDVVMDGRDIGSNVLKDADLKIFLTASIQERTKRRYQQLKEMEVETDFNKLKDEIISRDKRDSERKIDKLKVSDQAIVIDSTGDTEQKTAGLIIKLISELPKFKEYNNSKISWM